MVIQLIAITGMLFVNLIVKNINKKIQVTHLTFNKENKKSIGRGFNPNFFLPNL